MSKKTLKLSVREKIRFELTKALSISTHTAIEKGVFSLNMCKTWGDRFMEFELLHLLANWACEVKEDKLAEDYFLRAIAVRDASISDELWTNLYKDYSTFLWKRERCDAAIQYLQQAIFYANQLSDRALWLRCKNNLGGIYTRQGLFVEAKKEYDMVLEVATAFGYKDQLGRALLNVGVMYKLQHQYEKAMQRLLEAVRLFEQLGKKQEQAACLNTIANICLNRRAVEDALKYHQQTLVLFHELDSPYGLVVGYNNIGETYLQQGRFSDALNSFKEAFKFLEGQAFYLQLRAKVQSNIARAYFDLGTLGEAKQCLLASIAIREQLQDEDGLLTDYTQLGKIALRERDYGLAAHYLEKGRELSLDERSSYSLLMNYKVTKQLYRKTGELDLAIQYWEHYDALKDRLFDQRISKELADMQIKYETDKKEQENEWLQRQVALEKETKEHIKFLMRELHHRVTNNLQVLSSLLSLQANSLQDDYAKKILKNSEHRVVAMCMIHKELYLDQKKITSIDVSVYIQNLTRYLLLSFGYTNKDVELVFDIEKLDLRVKKVISLGLIINELVCNAFKHAFVNHPSPKLEIMLRRVEDKGLLVVRDNGQHANVQLNKKQQNSFGLELIDILSQELSGKMELKYDRGMVGELVFGIK